MKNIEQLARHAVDAAFAIHRDLGPGLLESVYEALVARSLEQRGLRIECQRPVTFTYNGIRFDNGFRADLLVEGQLLLELKPVEKLAPVHTKQVLTYLRLMDLPLGLLINFGAATFRDGVQRVLNTRADMSRIEVWKPQETSPEGG